MNSTRYSAFWGERPEATVESQVTERFRVEPSVYALLRWAHEQRFQMHGLDRLRELAKAGTRPSAVNVVRTFAIWRRDITVVHRTLEPDEARALAVVAAGATFAKVCEQLIGADAVPCAIELLLRWSEGELLAAAR